MEIIGLLFNEVFLRPILNALILVTQLVDSTGIPYSLGFSIILLTFLIRFAIYPLTTAQLRASKKMQTVAPHLSKLKEKHKGDAQKLQQETMRLYKEHGVNPAAGCIPALLQLPLFIGLYTVFQNIVKSDPKAVIDFVNSHVYIDALKISKIWDQYFFGLPLGKHPSELMSIMPLIVLVPVITGVLQFLQTKMMIPVKVEEKGKKEEKKDDFASAFQTQSLYIFPVMIGFFSFSFPIGLSLYWNTFTIFGILQQYHIQGLGGLEEWVRKYSQRIKIPSPEKRR